MVTKEKHLHCRDILEEFMHSAGRQPGRVVRALDLKSVGRGFKSRSDL